jgi:hypothetical protein
MNDKPPNERDRQLTGLLKNAVANVELSPAARTRMVARLRETARPSRSLWAWLVPATAAGTAAVLAVVGPALWQRSKPVTAQADHQPSWIECQATMYSKTEPDQWVRRSLIAHRRNGTESYIMVAAVRSLPNPQP